MNKPLVILIATVAAFSARTVSAHHGFAVHYDVANQIRIEGRVHEVILKNPHSEIRVAVEDEAGGTVVWTCETQAKAVLMRKGITRDRFPIGQPIVIEGSMARRNENHCEIGTAYLPDGTSVTMRSAAGRANIQVNANSVDTPRESRSVLGSWIRDTFSGVPVTPDVLNRITAAGREANAGYDGRYDDPTLDCHPVNPVRAWSAPGAPTKIRERDGRILIQHEFMDTTRTIFMDNVARPVDTERSEMGYSTGRFENDRLIVETTHFTAGVLLTHVKDSGVLHSQDFELTEEFGVLADSGGLQIRWEARDPKFFGKPITGQIVLSPTELQIGKFDCQRQSTY